MEVVGGYCSLIWGYNPLHLPSSWRPNITQTGTWCFLRLFKMENLTYLTLKTNTSCSYSLGQALSKQMWWAMQDRIGASTVITCRYPVSYCGQHYECWKRGWGLCEPYTRQYRIRASTVGMMEGGGVCELCTPFSEWWAFLLPSPGSPVPPPPPPGAPQAVSYA
jgi:hypothetical protein